MKIIAATVAAGILGVAVCSAAGDGAPALGAGPSEAFAVSLGGGRGTGADAISALVGMRYRRGSLLLSAVYTEVGAIGILAPEDHDSGLALLAGRHQRW